MKNKWRNAFTVLAAFSITGLLMNSAGSETRITYSKGDVMYVLSDSGLVLRASPDVKSSGICVLKYGTAVRITDDTPGRNSFAVGNYPGYWVKAAAQGKEGYLFDGFLSQHAAPSPCSGCRFNVIVEKYTDTAFTAKQPPAIRKDDFHQYQTKAYTNGCVLEKKEGLPGLPHFSLTLNMKRTRLPEAFLLFRLMGLELMKGQMLPGKSINGERKMNGLTYNETVTVTVNNNEIQRVLITESSKEEDGMGEGMEQESIEFIKTAEGTMVKYSASGS